MGSCDTVYKITSMPRWQRDWINSHRSINYSGLVQEMLAQVIAKNDPEYFMKHKPDLAKRPARKIEVTTFFLRS